MVHKILRNTQITKTQITRQITQIDTQIIKIYYLPI